MAVRVKLIVHPMVFLVRLAETLALGHILLLTVVAQARVALEIIKARAAAVAAVCLRQTLLAGRHTRWRQVVPYFILVSLAAVCRKTILVLAPQEMAQVVLVVAAVVAA